VSEASLDALMAAASWPGVATLAAQRLGTSVIITARLSLILTAPANSRVASGGARIAP
jgi:hypothetical protein